MSEKSTEIAASDWKAGSKRHFVMAHALDLLIESGYQGLSMRGVAERAGMSLSNVQYYFRSKDALIAEIADRYFGECATILCIYFAENGPVQSKTDLQKLVALFLDHGREMTNMCHVFRELWAIAARDQTVGCLVDAHYRRLADMLSAQIKYPTAEPAVVDRLVAALLVISEGYSIVGRTHSFGHAQALSLYTDLMMQTAAIATPLRQ